jgi:transposase-like protein
MAGKLTVRDFFKRYPDDAACLKHVMEVRFGLRHTCRACGTVDATFHPLAKRRAYTCAHCGDHLYPCAGTIFQDSRTPLTLWFYAIYLFVTTRHGVSGKELERQLGVTYKTAWRMGQQIRQLMGNVDEFVALKGHVEIDEAYVGGRRPGQPGRPGAGDTKKTAVLGMKERGGPMYAHVIPDAKLVTLREAVLMNVQPKTTVSTDEHLGYNLLTRDGYRHGAVKHSAEEWTKTDEDGVVHHTNHVESFWWLFKRSIKSTHIHVSQKYMNRYLDEFTFRSNHREMQNAMFDLLIGAV